MQGSLPNRKGKRRKAASRHTTSQWPKGVVWCDKGRWHSTYGYGPKNAIKKTFDRRFAIPLNFDFFRHPIYVYGLKDLVVRLELNSAEKVILCIGDTSATYKLSDISLEYDAIFNKKYSPAIGQMYTNMSIPYTNITSRHYLKKSLFERLM